MFFTKRKASTEHISNRGQDTDVILFCYTKIFLSGISVAIENYNNPQVLFKI